MKNSDARGGQACYLPLVEDDALLLHVADRLGELPRVEAVTLGGSRAEGTHRPDSDWDFSIYYRGQFDPQTLRDIGWPGEVSEVGGWSKGVFNGGAWLEIDGRRTDVHYRDLDTVDREILAAGEGRFAIEPLMFHLAPGLLPRQRPMRRMPCWPRAASGSPTRRPCSPARACATSMSSWPPRSPTRPCCVRWWSDPEPSARMP